MKLSAAMRSNLAELAQIADTNYGEASWGPESPGEWRCAEALERRGLLRRNVSRGRRPFSLTPEGLEAGRAALPRTHAKEDR